MRVVAVIVLVFFVLNCAPVLPQYESQVYDREKPIVISERVGETINAAEVEQFGLFPALEEFTAATFYAAEDGGYDVVILTESETLLAVNRDPNAVVILRDYIDNYDKYAKSQESFEKKWNIVAYDDLGFPITAHEVSQVRNWPLACVFGAGFGLLGIVPFGWLAMLVGGYQPNGLGEFDNPVAALITIIAGTVVSIALGVVIGNKISNKEALKAIKEARKSQDYGVRASARTLGAVE
jgi:hypothetical protein